MYYSGHEECVKILISRGADLSAIDKDNLSALHRAVKNNHQSIVELLIKQKNYKEIQENHEVIIINSKLISSDLC